MSKRTTLSFFEFTLDTVSALTFLLWKANIPCEVFFREDKINVLVEPQSEACTIAITVKERGEEVIAWVEATAKGFDMKAKTQELKLEGDEEISSFNAAKLITSAIEEVGRQMKQKLQGIDNQENQEG